VCEVTKDDEEDEEVERKGKERKQAQSVRGMQEVQVGLPTYYVHIVVSEYICSKGRWFGWVSEYEGRGCGIFGNKGPLPNALK
jgi:hypothetical protein